MGAATAATAFLFNGRVHDAMERANQTLQQSMGVQLATTGASIPYWMKQKPLPGEMMTYPLLITDVVVGGGYACVGAACAATYAGPGAVTLVVRYGTITILGNYGVYNGATNFVMGLSPSPPQGWWGIGGYGTKWAYDNYLAPYLNK